MEIPKLGLLNFSKDFQLLLACLRKDSAEIISLCNNHINWSRFMQSTYWHKVTPLVYPVLQQCAKTEIPQTVLFYAKP